MFDPTTLVGFHTWLSLIALAAGAVVAASLTRGRDLPRAAALFLVTAFLTSATGYLFPFTSIQPSHIVGVLSLLALAVAVLARYRFRAKGGWRAAYVISVMAAEWFLIFVGIAQSFLKVPALQAAAPTGAELPFLLTQLAGLIAVVVLAILALRAGRRAPDVAAYA